MIFNSDKVTYDDDHETSPTQCVEVNGVRLAYRRFGITGALLLVFNQHYRTRAE